jgi:electron transfer flavoprotein alpha subunit
MFGFLNPNDPVDHFERAEMRLDALQDEVKSLMTTGDSRYGVIVKAISILGDIPLATAVAETMNQRGDYGASKVILASTMRRENRQPEKALEILEEVLTTNVNDYALNSKTGALMDMFYKTGDRSYLAVAQEAMSLSLSIVPSNPKRIEYTANAVARVLKVARPELRAEALAIANYVPSAVHIESHEIPEAKLLTSKVVGLLVELGRRDLAELQLAKLNDPNKWAHKVRLHADVEPL